MNSLRPGLLALIFILTGIYACSGRHNPGKSTSAALLPGKGKVIPDVQCLKNNTVSYALYLPTTYDKGKKLPVIVAFDPEGSGTLPVEKYKNLAEDHHCILLCSNNSRNGQTMNDAGVIIQELFDEIHARYSIDTNRIYTMGFSGGARIASLIALYQYPVAGVIGCGAGFPGNQSPRSKFDYIGIAGNADFNMNELVSLDNELEGLKFRHALVIFDGIHAWPPVDVMKEAFIWNDFCAMKDNKMTKDRAAIDAYLSFMKEKIARESQLGEPLKTHRDLLNEIRFLDGITETDSFKTELADLEKNPAYKKALKAENKTAAYEAEQQKMLNDNFFTQELPWWKRTINGYNSRIHQAKDSNDVQVCRRLKSYLSLLSYMSYSRVLSSHDTTAAEKAMQIYELVDPENAEKTRKVNVK